MALLLSLAAGMVDIVGYLSVYHAFTANLTGDSVHFGQYLLDGRWRDVALLGAILAAFLAGSIFGRTLVEMGARNRLRRIASLNLVVQAVLIAVAAGLSLRGPAAAALLLVLLAVAMGLQSATLTRVGCLTVHTTFVTGMINKFAQLFSHALFAGYDVLRGRPQRENLRKVLRRAEFIGSIWVVYVVGAILGTWLRSMWGMQALLVPAGMILACLVVDQAAPLSVQEEHDEPER